MNWNTATQSMREHPAKWVGIAAGAGFGLGLIGRLLRWRRQRRREQLIVIESC